MIRDSIMLSGENLKKYLYQSQEQGNGVKNKAMESPLSNHIQYSTLHLSHSNGKHDREKGKEIEKKEVKTFSFANGMVIYTKGTKKTSRKFLQLINTLIKVAGCKIDMQTSITFLYKKERHSEKEVGKTT